MQQTNLYELLECDRLEHLMHWLGVEDAYRNASDYERFSLLLRHAPSFPYHLFSQGLSAYLREQFGIDAALTQKNAEMIWKSVAEQLLFKQAEPFAPVSIPLQTRPQELLSLPTVLSGADFLDGNELLKAFAHTTNEWQEIGDGLVITALKEGKKGVLFFLSKDFNFASPDPYHVSLALSDATVQREASDLLCTQAVRILFALCQKYACPMLLITECDPFLLAPLLDYLCARVGRASLLWAARAAERARLLSCASRVPLADLRLVLDAQALTHEELLDELSALAPEYPVGRLCLLQ